MASLKDLGNSLQGFFSNAGKAVSSALPQVGQAVWNATPIGQVQQLQKLAPQVQSFIQKYPSPASYFQQQPIVSPLQQQQQPNMIQQAGYAFARSPVARAIESAQKFVESPQQVNLPQVPSQINFGVGPIKPLQMARDIINTPISYATNTGLDFAQNVGKTIRGDQLAKYNELKSPVTKLGYQIGGIAGNAPNLNISNKPQEILANVAGTIEGPLSVDSGGKVLGLGIEAAKQATKQTLKQLIIHGTKEGAKQGLLFGMLQGLQEGKDKTIPGQLVDAATYGLGGATLGGALGGGMAAGGHAFGSMVNIIKKFNPNFSPEQAIVEAKNFLKSELGNFVGVGKRKNEPVFYGDLRESLGLPRNGDYQTGAIDFGAEVGTKLKLELPKPESLQPMAKLPQVGEMAPLAPEVQNTQFPKTGTVPTQAALKSKPTGFEAEMDALAAQTKPTITTIGKKKPLPKMAGSDAEKLAEKAQLNAEGNKKGFQKIFSDLIGERNAAQTKGVQVGSKIRILPANPEEVIKAIENPGMKVSPETEKYIAQFRALDDEVFAQAKKLGLDINYLKEHIAHFWKQDPQEVQQAYAVFKQKYGLTERRVIPTYEEGIKMGLTPKFTSPAQILAESIKKLEETKAGMKAFESLKEQGLIVPASVGTKNLGFVPISAPGFPRNATQINDQLGTVGNWYAPKAIADQINRVFSSQDFGPLGSMLDKAAGLSGKIQDLGLSGGLPGTPMNAFGAAQVTKETLAGRGIQGVTSFIRSFSDTATRNYFEKNSQQLIKMQERNIPISTNFSINDLAGDGIGSNVSSAINNLIKGQFGPAKDAIGSIWQKAMNEPTFKRFMPQLQVELFNDIERSALKQGKSANEAADIAAQAVKNFYGSTGSDVAARAQGIHDPLVQKTLSTLTFAPKFRESMINFWVNNIKALKNPTALENRANITFVGGAIATYIAMDKINYALNGKHLNENPPGTEDKLLIPTGNGDVIGVPFLSSIATIPRALYREGKMVVSGDIKGAAKDAFQSYASMMIKPIADVVSNADYFGKKIYNEEDKPQEKFAAQAKYLVSQLAIHPYLKELFTPSKQDDPIYQRLSRSMELPLKFYTNASLNSKYYYSERDKAVGGLSDQEKSALAAIPKADSEDPNTRILKYQTYLTYPKVFDAKQKIELEMAAKTGKAIDPLYLVNYDVAKKYMRYETLPEGSQDRKEMTKAYPELLGLFQARSKYFTENPYPGSGSGSSRPVPSPAVQQAMNNQNWTAPGVREYLNANTAYNNAQREKLGLPPLAGYTQYAKKPKKVKIIKAKAMKTPKMGKTKVANFKIAKPKKVKVTKSKPITYRSIMSKA